MTRLWLAIALLSAPVARAEVPPEVQLALLHLREGERPRAEAALGPLEQAPLFLAELEVDPEARAIRGQLRMRWVAREAPLRRVLLRLTPNASRPDRVTLEGLQSDRGVVKVERPEPSLLVIHLEPPVPVGESVTLRAVLTAEIPRAPARPGLLALSPTSGGGDHGAFSATEDVLSAIGVLPGLAVPEHAAPSGIGDPASYEPANYLISLTVPRGWRALATGVGLGEVPAPDGRIRFSYGAALVREFPVLVVRGYTRLQREVGGVTVESHFAAGMEAAGKRSLDMAADSLAAMEQRLGKIPWKVLRVVEAPLTDGAGGMEFPGLVTVSSELYRAASGQSGVSALLGQLQAQLSQSGFPSSMALPDVGALMSETLDFTVAHEVAHQYFACLVGSDPVGAPVADEPLAQHLALRALEWTRGVKAAEAVREGQLRASYQFFRMSGGQDGRAARSTGEFQSELEYAALVYGKAPFLHDAERKQVGDAAHLSALRAYVDRYRYKWACADCFSKVLVERNPRHAEALTALRERWLHGRSGDADLGKVDLAGLLRGAEVPPETLKLIEELLRAHSP